MTRLAAVEVDEMIRSILAGLALSAASIPALAAGGASGFTLVNATGKPLSAIALRRAGTSEWHAVGGGASPGASTSVKFSDPDCGFDLQASAGGATIVWKGVNLCEVKSLTLHLDASGTAWAEYD